MSAIRTKLLAQGNYMEVDHEYKATIVEMFLVETSSQYDRALRVYIDTEGMPTFDVNGLPTDITAIPPMWTPYHWDPILAGTYAALGSIARIVLIKKRVSRLIDDNTDFTKWIVECTYGQPPEGWTQDQAGQPGTTSPLNDPVRYTTEWGMYTIETASHYLGTDNVEGTALTNFAGDLYDPPIEKDDDRTTVVALKNFSSYEEILNLARNYQNTTNSETFLDNPPYTAKIESITSGPRRERYGIVYYQARIRIQLLNQSGTGTGTGTGQGANWNVKRPNRGWQHYETVDGQKIKHYPRVTTGDHEGEYLDQTNLNEDGEAVIDDDKPIMSEYRIYPAKDLNDIGIGL